MMANNSVTPPNASLGHEAFMETVDYAIENGATADERYIAELLRDMYLLVCEHPVIVNMMNQRVLQAMEKSDGTQ